MGKRLIICSRQKEYIFRLAECIDNRKELNFNLGLCISSKKLQLLEEKQDIDILIIDEEFSYEIRKKSMAKIKFVLTQGTCPDLGKEEEEIYQYQPAAKIITQILERCTKEDGMNVFKRYKRENHEIIGVYSPIHRIGKSEFAVTLTRALARTQKALYLSLEEYSRISGENESTLADILYCLKQEGSAPGMRINSAVTEINGISTILPIPFSMDLKEVEHEEWTLLFHKILEESMFSTLVLDFSESVQGLFSLLEMCDVIYMPIIEKERNGPKILQYEQMLEKLNYVSLVEKTELISMESSKDKCAQEILKKRRGSHDTGRDVV